jgi:menaquinone-specific isochorismate synthase
MALSVIRNSLRQCAELNLESFFEEGALLSLPGEHILLAWGPSRISQHSDAARASFYRADFFLKQVSWRVFENCQILSRTEFAQILAEHLPTEPAQISRTWQQPERSEFHGYFAEVQQWISRGQLKKAVPVVFARSGGSFKKVELVRSLYKSIVAARGLNVYGHWQRGQGQLGVTPEILFEGRPPQMKTMALAGTGKGEQSLLTDPKELHEHKLVIQAMSEALAGQNIHWAQTKEWQLGAIKHLLSEAQFNWEGGFHELVETLHPTPALGVSPRHPEHLKWLKKVCPAETERWFGAPFGVATQGYMKCLVAIRNIQWNSNEVQLGSGCGLVQDSVEHKEWQELELKRAFTAEFLGL